MEEVRCPEHADDLNPQWQLLKSSLETKGPNWYSPTEREERLISNKSNRSNDDIKDALRTDGDPVAWQTSTTAQNQLWQLLQPAPPLVFPGKQEIFLNMYPTPGGRANNFPSIYLQSGGCIHEETKRRERSRVKTVP